MKSNYKYSEITKHIISAFYNVYFNLRYGFLEKVYEKAMVVKLSKFNLVCQLQKSIKVFFDEIEVRDYIADIVVNDLIILELKTVKNLTQIHEVQLVNYLKATRIEVGLLLNFGPVPQNKRRVLSNKIYNHVKSAKS